MKKTKHPLVSFIMPNYNNEHVLDLFFEKFLENNTYDNYEFIVVDDGSGDNGLELLYKWQKSSKIKNMQVIAEPHKGIINALNKALFAAKGEFIIRCDGDATLESKSPVEKFLEFYNICPEKIGVITAKVITDTGILHAIGRDIISEDGLHDRGKYIREKKGARVWDCFADIRYDLARIIDKPAEVDSALGVFTFCDRETALKIGGFDDNYPLWIEDDDFYLGFRKYGKKCFYLPNIEICHRFSLRGSRNAIKKKILMGLIVKVVENSAVRYKLFGKVTLLKKRHEEYSCKVLYKILGVIKFHKKGYSWREGILLHDYAYWKKKWGFDCLNPNMTEIKKKWAGTEILWNYIPEMKKQGEEIIKKYLSVSKISSTKISKCKILTCYHKPYAIVYDSTYTPIHLGRALAVHKTKDCELNKKAYQWLLDNMIGDDTGDNISELNQEFCEISAMYWAWKNYDKLGNPAMVGFAHYRRHFIFNDPANLFCFNRWLPNGPFFSFYEYNQQYAKYIEFSQKYEEYDIILPHIYDFRNLDPEYKSPRDNYIKLGHREIYYDKMLKVIESDYPEYRKAMEKFDTNTFVYICNMFLMKKEIFFEYCEFLFGVLFKIRKDVDTTHFSIHEKRGLAFLAEFILSIFIFKKIEDANVKIHHIYLSYLCGDNYNLMNNTQQFENKKVKDKNYVKCMLKLWRYKLASKLMFGKTRSKYKEKYKQMRNYIKKYKWQRWGTTQ